MLEGPDDDDVTKHVTWERLLALLTTDPDDWWVEGTIRHLHARRGWLERKIWMQHGRLRREHSDGSLESLVTAEAVWERGATGGLERAQHGARAWDINHDLGLHPAQDQEWWAEAGVTAASVDTTQPTVHLGRPAWRVPVRADERRWGSITVDAENGLHLVREHPDVGVWHEWTRVVSRAPMPDAVFSDPCRGQH